MADTLSRDQRIDLVVFDSHDQPVLAVEVKALTNVLQLVEEWMGWLDSEVRSAGYHAPYWMFVDLEQVVVFSREYANAPWTMELITLTPLILTAYDQDFGRKRIFDDYLRFLVETWLRDLTSECNSTDPDALKKLTEIGLAERLKGGSIHRGVTIGNFYPLRRNQLPHESFPEAGLDD